MTSSDMTFIYIFVKMWSSSEFLTWMFGKRGHAGPSNHIIMPAHITWQWHQIPIITSFFKYLPLQINLASTLGGEYTGQTVSLLSQQQVGKELVTGLLWLNQNIECCVLTVHSYWGTLYCRWSSFHMWFGKQAVLWMNVREYERVPKNKSYISLNTSKI
jgi:hypothetical protein